MELCYAFLDRAAGELGCPCVAGEPMSRHTTFQIGGPADRFITVETLPQLKGLVKALGPEGLPFLLLGKGSNLLVADRGIRGAVLLLSGDFKNVELREDGLLRAGAGASLASVCAFAREHSLTGLEFAWGIPGSVGGAAYMDAGAYGGEMKDVVERVCHLTPAGGRGQRRWGELAVCLPEQPLHRRPGDHHLCGVPPGPGGPGPDLRPDGGADGPAQEKQPYDMPSAGSVFKRPRRALRRRPHRGVRPEGPPGGGRPGQREARRVHRQHRRGHLRRRAGPHPADPGRGV